MVRPKNCNLKRLQNFQSNKNKPEIEDNKLNEITPEQFLTRIHQYGYCKFQVSGKY
jgi:hypothetical protein